MYNFILLRVSFQNMNRYVVHAWSLNKSLGNSLQGDWKVNFIEVNILQTS